MLRIAAHTLEEHLHPLAPTESEPSVPLRINGPANNGVTIYLHGRLHDDNGFDIATPHGGELNLPTPTNPAVDEPCLVLFHDRVYPVRARLVMWHTDHRALGLVAY